MPDGDPILPEPDLPAVLSSIPEPIKATFLKAASRLVGGLLMYPAAGLRRLYQPIEDTTDARSVVSRGLANALVDSAKNDPVIMQAVADAYLPDAVRKLRNKTDIVRDAAKYLTEEPIPAGAQPSDPDEDWMNAFIRHAEDASSDRLKKLFSKILAGEILNAGAFSKSTLRIVSELTNETAEDFSHLFAQTVGGWLFCSSAITNGKEWSRVVRLQAAGFLAPSEACQSQPKSTLIWRVSSSETTFLIIKMFKQIEAYFSVILLTRMGSEIGQLLPAPDLEKSLRTLATELSKRDVNTIVLHTPQGEELLYKREAE
jgi:hypothetical protein